jgi:uncharacterized protein YndB with AHSA1/START domain
MRKLEFSIHIDVPRQTAWKTMLEDESYRIWTAEFSAGSYYAGDWSKGSRMLFLAPGKSGKVMGMISRVLENRPYEFISLQHIGLVRNGIEDTTSEAVKAWAGALENYTFADVAGGTRILVELDTEESFLKMFEDQWPKALRKLKEVAEK